MSRYLGYIQLAEDCLKAARILHEQGSHRQAVGRAYYAYFDAIRALLATKDIYTKTHAALRSLFGEYFIKLGFSPAKMGNAYTNSFSYDKKLSMSRMKRLANERPLLPSTWPLTFCYRSKHIYAKPINHK